MYRILLPAVIASACAAGEFTPVQEARVDVVSGVPRLTINGVPKLPLLLFPNTDIRGEHSIPFQRSQTRLARDAGVDIISFPLRVGRKNAGSEQDYAHADACLARFVEENPDALFLLRMYPGPWRFWSEFADIPEDEIALYADGSRGIISIASDYFWGMSNGDFVKTIRYLEDGPYGERIIGYWPGGPQHEMFPDNYRLKGPDYCKANQAKFRAWLRANYEGDAALQAAWGRDEVTLDTACVPETEPGRFPMHGVRADATAAIFYALPEEQAWVDYSRYVSDIAADRILDWARLVKRETGGKKLVGFFYGYNFELCGSFSAHDQIHRVLECPDVDLLGSPISYMGRLGGDPGGFMSLVDTIAAHGKLWFNEDDMRTSIVDPAKVPGNAHLWHGMSAKSAGEDQGVLGRNLGAALVHRAGTWWMDLVGAGAFDAPAMWALMEARAPLFQEVYDHPTPYRPDAAVLVDLPSRSVIKSDWDASYRNLVTLRNESMKSGAAVGFYSLSDFVDGVVPRCKAYVFANAFCLSDEQTQAIRSRLDREGATAVWLYAPGCFGPQGFDVTRAEAVTGIRLVARDGLQGSRGTGPLAGDSWGWAAPVAPRTVVDDAEAEIIGRYVSDGSASAAQKDVGRHRSIFLGDLAVNAGVLRTLFEQAGAHLWTRDGEVVQTDGRSLMVHRGPPGVVSIRMPGGVRGEVIAGTVIEAGPEEVVVRFNANESVWLRLTR